LEIAYLRRAQAQELSGAALHLCREQDVEGETFKEQRESSVGRGPRDLHRLNSTSRAIDPRHARGEQSLELTGVQMPPGTRREVVVNWSHLLTHRTTEQTRLSRMRQHHGNFRLRVVDLNRFDKPRSGNAKNLLVKFSGLHPIIDTLPTQILVVPNCFARA